jgi:[ribosomal protein S18]-alanine N-acetyltransferase
MTDELEFFKLNNCDLDAMFAIEEKVYPFPWTRGNFLDSFESGHAMIGLRDQHDGEKTSQLVAYLIAMQVLDELHLLNLAVALAYQEKGLGKRLLNHLITLAEQHSCCSILLEVRVSNQRAIDVYKVAGFVEIGRRKNYYPTHQQCREDAIVMRCLVVPQV